MTWAIIRSSEGFSYQLTDDDVLWATRMAAYEGDAARTLWTLTQRYVLMRPSVSFGEFLQRFSQPISQAWSRTGTYCAPGGRYAETDACSETRLARRDQARVATIEDLERRSRRAVDIVHRWATAALQNPVPRAIDFAAPTVAAHWLTRNAGQLVDRAGNWFMANAESLLWSADHVFMQLGKNVASATKPSSYSWFWWLLAGGAATAGGVYWYQRRQAR